MPGGSEGPNWILLAGGAAVTALSYVIRRRQKHVFEDRVEERQGKSGIAQLANQNDGFEAEYRPAETSRVCPYQDSLDGLPMALAISHSTSLGELDDATNANTHQDTQGMPSSVEFFEEEKRLQRRLTSSQEDVRRSNHQGVQIGLPAKRDMVHRLRKQLKSRDEMILRMQVQISKYERSLSLSDAQVSELQARLEATSSVLSDLNKEVHLFRNQLAEHVKFDAKMDDGNISAARSDGLTSNCGDERRDMSLTLLELTNSREILGRLKEEKNAREIERQALLEEYNSMIVKVEHLECALDEYRMLVFEKERLLDTTQVELVEATSRLQAQVKETESLSRTKTNLETCIDNLNSRGLILQDLQSSEEIISSTCTEVSDTLSHPQDRGDPELLDAGDKFEIGSHDNNDPVIRQNVVAALQREVEQLSTSLASRSELVTAYKEQTTRLVEDVKANELNVKLDELVKFKEAEEQMIDVTKYQAKIAELRHKISNLTQDNIEVRNEQSLHVAALICGLAEKLASQEEQAKQTALEVQHLSTTFQLLTPIVAKLQDKNTDFPLAGQPNSGEMFSYEAGHIKFNSASVLPTHAAQGTIVNKAITHRGRQNSDASDCSTLSDNHVSKRDTLTEMVHDDYQFRMGASGLLGTKIRKFSSKCDGENGHRKKPFTHNYVIRSDAEKNTPSPFEVEQAMAASTPDPGAIDFAPTLEEFSPPVRQSRSPRHGIESSRRYLFKTAKNYGDHANISKASSGYGVNTAEDYLEEESTSERSFLVERFDAASISPFSKMVAQLDSTEELRETSSSEQASVELLLLDSPLDAVEDGTGTLDEGDTSFPNRLIRDSDESEANTFKTNRFTESEVDNVSEAIVSTANGLIDTEDGDDLVSESEERGSIDSEFDEMLDGSLDDLVKILSASVTPASTPRSSLMSLSSGSKRFQ